jgi:hypothetical protein
MENKLDSDFHHLGSNAVPTDARSSLDQLHTPPMCGPEDKAVSPWSLTDAEGWEDSVATEALHEIYTGKQMLEWMI